MGRPGGVTRVLIAVDESDESVEAARVAHQLFGDEAEYLVVNVSDPIGNAMAWGYVYPIVPPIAAYPVMMPSADVGFAGPGTAAGDGGGETKSATEQAEDRAADVVEQAHLGDAETIGEVGDAASAILEAAERARSRRDRGRVARAQLVRQADEGVGDEAGAARLDGSRPRRQVAVVAHTRIWHGERATSW